MQVLMFACHLDASLTNPLRSCERRGPRDANVNFISPGDFLGKMLTVVDFSAIVLDV